MPIPSDKDKKVEGLVCKRNLCALEIVEEVESATRTKAVPIYFQHSFFSLMLSFKTFRGKGHPHRERFYRINTSQTFQSIRTPTKATFFFRKNDVVIPARASSCLCDLSSPDRRLRRAANTWRHDV